MKFNPSTIVPPALLSVLLGGCATHTSLADLYGMPAPAVAAGRTIIITSDTRYVNVEGGEIVRFVSGNKEFGWHFLVAPSISSLPLNQVAPARALTHPVTAYIAPDPRYVGGDDDS